MRQLLILTGTCGVGKSTVARAWAAKRGGAAISGDEVREWIARHELEIADNFQEELVARVCASAARVYMAAGMDIAIENVWGPQSFAYFHRELGADARILAVWLRCHREENRCRDRGRLRALRMGKRVDELMDELESLPWPEWLHALDTTGQSVHETVAEIERLAEATDARRNRDLAADERG